VKETRETTGGPCAHTKKPPNTKSPTLGKGGGEWGTGGAGAEVVQKKPPGKLRTRRAGVVVLLTGSRGPSGEGGIVWEKS